MSLILFSYFAYLLPIVFFVATRRNRKVSLWGTLFLAAMLLALRDGIGYDYRNYELFYYIERFPSEPLSALIFKLSLFFNDSLAFFIIYAVLTILFVGLSAEKIRNRLVVLNYLIIPWFFVESFTLVRQGLSVSICIYAYALYTANDRRAIYICLIAVLVHYSAVPFVLAIVFLMAPLRRGYFYLPLGALFSGLLFPVVFSKIVESGLVPTLVFYSGEGGSFGYIRLSFACLLFLFTCFFPNSVSIFVARKNRKSALSNHYSIVLTGLILSVALIPFDPSFARLSFYFFIPFVFVNWGRCFYYFRASYIFVYLSLILGYLVIIYIKSGDRLGALVPYYCHYFCN